MPEVMARVAAIIVAAGSGERMGGVDKAFLLLDGCPLILHTLHVFQECAAVGNIILILQRTSVERGRALVKGKALGKVAEVLPGGPTRTDSVREGLAHLPPGELVVVHDGARPCLEEEVILRGLEAVERTGAAVAAIPVQDALKRDDGAGRSLGTLAREGLWAAQTPQLFRRDVLEKAYSAATNAAVDDAALVEAMGHPVTLFQGSAANIKITTPEDLELAEAILARRRSHASRHRI